MMLMIICAIVLSPLVAVAETREDAMQCRRMSAIITFLCMVAHAHLLPKCTQQILRYTPSVIKLHMHLGVICNRSNSVL